MNFFWYAKYCVRLWRIYPQRYRAFFQLINERKCRIFLEIGTNNGIRARQMIETARIHHSLTSVQYWGVDLFEDLTPDLLSAEYAIRPPSCMTVTRMLEKTGAFTKLFKGNSKEMLLRIRKEIGQVDFIFIDGGHSIETIQSDWDNCQHMMSKNTLVIFDDYFVQPSDPVKNVGCNQLVDRLDQSEYAVSFLPIIDEFTKPWGILRTQMVAVHRT